MGHAAVEHHELLAQGGGCVAELAEADALGLAEDAEEMGGRGGGGHPRRAVEARVVIDRFCHGFGRVFHHLPLRLALHRRHFARLDFLVGFLAHGLQFRRLAGREDGVEIEFQRGLQVVAVAAHLRFGGFHGRGRRFAFHHQILAGRHLHLAADLLLVCPGGPFEILEVPGGYDAVVKHLAEHAALRRGGEIPLAVLAHRERHIRCERRAAVGVGKGDDADQAPQVEPARHELMREEIQSRCVVHVRVGREIVQRFDEAATDHFGPDAVHIGTGEEIVAGVGDEFRELSAQFAGSVDIAVHIEQAAVLFRLGEDGIFLFPNNRLGGIEQGVERCGAAALGGLACLFLAEFLETGEVAGRGFRFRGLEGETRIDGLALLRLCLVFRWPEDGHLVAFRRVNRTPALVADLLRLSEKRREVIEIALLPIVEGMVVAHRATHAHAEEHLGGGGGEFHRVRVVAEDEADRRVRVRAAGGGDELPRHLVVGFPSGEGTVDVGEELVAALDVGTDSQHVRHENRPAVGEARMGEQFLHQLRAAVFAPFLEFIDLRHRRDAPDQVDRCAAEENPVSDGLCGDGLRACVFAAEDVIDDGSGIGGGFRGAIRDGNALDRLRFLLNEFQPLRPWRARLHPGVQHRDLARLQRAAFIGHHALVDGAEVEAHQNFAGRWISGDEGIRRIAALHDRLIRIHPQPALGVVLVMATQAVLLEDRLDVRDEIRARSRLRGEHRKCQGGESGRFGGHLGWVFTLSGNPTKGRTERKGIFLPKITSG